MSNTSTLNAIASSGSQVSTQDPQTSVSSSGLGGGQSAVQPGTAASLLTSSSGIQLGSGSVPTIALTTSTATPAQTNSTQAAHRAINPVLLTLAIILFVAAIVLFVSTTRSAKSTTK